MYESSGRYKELRDIYETKLEAKESELLQAKESIIQNTLKEEMMIKEHQKLVQSLKDEHQKEAQTLKDEADQLKKDHADEIKKLKE